ncbi:MAG: GGDEF domain-containing protein [Terracidiphilus sp.]
MRNRTVALLSDQPDPALLHRLFFAQQVCLALVVEVAGMALAAQLFAPLARLLPIALTDMSVPLATAALLCALGLFLSEPGRSARMIQVSRFLAGLAVLIAAALLLAPAFPASFGLEAFLKTGQTALNRGGTPLRPASAFVFLAVITVLVRASRSLASHIADVIASVLCFLVLVLVSECIFGSFHILGPSVTGLTSPPTLVCLMLLTAVAVFRRAEYGMFSIFLGHGIGSRIARFLSPFLLVMPLLREALRARLINSHVIPVHYATAILSSTATLVSFALLLFLGWRINGMEKEIHALTLRDELTGLYNLRGFQLLAGQSLRLAQRAQLAFSVLFIDLDNLKVINDEMGHGAGSALLAETGELLNSLFRETDVIGRIGGDEFAVAGQFNQAEISMIAKGLDEASALRNSKNSQQFPLSFSIGHVTSLGNSRETLKDLVSKADKAMYQEKRRKKLHPR